MAHKKTYAEKLADHIAEVVRTRRIEDVLHFTLLKNLPGILKDGLLSRSILPQLDYDVFASDADRLDGDDGAISVSISCYYPKMFEAKRRRSGNAPWAILVFDPCILWNYRCRFFCYGAATEGSRSAGGKPEGGYALDRLFRDCSPSLDMRGTGFRAEHGLEDEWPTFPEAEVQVMEPINSEHLLGVWVESCEQGDNVRAVLHANGCDDCDVVVRPFAPRISKTPYFWG